MVNVREVFSTTYEVDVDDDFDNYSDFEAVADYLYANGAPPGYVENECVSEEIVAVWQSP